MWPVRLTTTGMSPAPPRPTGRTAAVVAGAAAAVLVLGAVVWQLGDNSESTSTSGGSTTSVATTATTPGSTELVPDPTYGVGRREVALVDASRPTKAWSDGGVTARPNRPLPTLVLYPTADPASDGATDPEAAEGPFPLVVFSHGSGGDPTYYAPFLAPLVRQGYVVALPTFPLTSLPGSPYDDVGNQPADVSFVLDELLALSDDSSSWLGGRIDADHIAAAGHSLGAITTIGVTYDACCIDKRFDAAVAISGTGIPSGSGTLDDPPPTPLLLIHGALDETVPVSGSDGLFDAATGPTYYLRLDNADHTNFSLDAAGALTAQVVAAFLDAYLRERPAGLAEIPAAVASSGLGEWRTRNVT